MTRSKARRFLSIVLVYSAILVVTLLVIDGICVAFDLFPPVMNYGDPDLGWRPAPATGGMAKGNAKNSQRAKLSFTNETTMAFERG